MPLGTAFQSIPTFVRLYLAPKNPRMYQDSCPSGVPVIAPFFALLVVAAGWSYLRGNTEGAVVCLVVLGVLWLALQLFGPYTSLRNRVIFVVGTERLQQWAIETLDHPPPADPFGRILLEANDLPEDIRTLAGTYTGVTLSEDGRNDFIQFEHGDKENHWGIVVGRPGCNPSRYNGHEKIAEGIWGYRVFD